MRQLKNRAERAFQQFADQRSFEITKRGWPDFFCISKSGEFFVVEVKRTRHSRLKASQEKVLSKFMEYGIRCYLWFPEMGLLDAEDYFLAKKREGTIGESSLIKSCK